MACPLREDLWTNSKRTDAITPYILSDLGTTQDSGAGECCQGKGCLFQLHLLLLLLQLGRRQRMDGWMDIGLLYDKVKIQNPEIYEISDKKSEC